MSCSLTFVHRVDVISHIYSVAELEAMLSEIPRDESVVVINHRYTLGLEFWYAETLQNDYKSATVKAINALVEKGIPGVFFERWSRNPEEHERNPWRSEFADNPDELRHRSRQWKNSTDRIRFERHVAEFRKQVSVK